MPSSQLGGAVPSDKPHLLLWDRFDEHELKTLAFYNNADVVSYRQDLLNRLPPNISNLALHEDLEQELRSVRQICHNSSKEIVILTDLDCLIAYLLIQPEAKITLFWQSLYRMRHLEKILWILLPSKLAPPMWSEDRLHRLQQT
jgi:hypothetical protein